MGYEGAKSASAWILFVIAAIFALTLAGCGNDAADNASSASGANSTASDSVDSDAPAEISAVSKSMLSGVDASKAVDLSTLLVDGDESVAALEPGDVGMGIDDESKAPTGRTLITCGGIQILLPSTWNYRIDPDGWSLASRDGLLEGGLIATPRSASLTYDVEAMAASVPQVLNEAGATNCQVLSFDNVYSSKGALCASYIYCDAMIDGQVYRCFYEYVLSASNVNCLYLFGSVDNVVANASELGSIVDSLAFNPGEEI